jgi:hypothetical protein
MARPKKPETKSTAATKTAAGKPKKKAAASVKAAAAKVTTPDLVVPTQSSTLPLEEISDLLKRLPLQACVELTRRLHTSISSLPTGADHPRVVLKTAILFVAEYDSTPWRTEQSKLLRLACWNADGVSGRKLELQHFLNQHGVDFYLLSRTFLKPFQDFRFVNYVCQRTDSLTAGAALPSWSTVV